MWKNIDTAPRNGDKILVHEGDGELYITQWVEDVWSWQGGHGGPCGWFSGKYLDRWADYPNLDAPKFWQELPKS